MKFEIKFLKSAVIETEYPDVNLPEVALTGRSNAGKSSFLNQFGRQLVAKVSGTPGKTRLVNFFEVNKKYRWVDLPGYGFAKRSADEEESWGPMVETYLGARPNLAGAILLMDVRRDWGRDEDGLKEFLERRGVPLVVVATKIDKLKKSELESHLVRIHSKAHSPVFPVSNIQKLGAQDVESYCYETWIKGWTLQDALVKLENLK